MRTTRLITLTAATALLAALLVTSTATAAPSQIDTAAQTQAESSQDDGPEANLPYLFAAYTITWIGFFAYLYYVSQRQRALRREVEALREALEERDKRDREAG